MALTAENLARALSEALDDCPASGTPYVHVANDGMDEVVIDGRFDLQAACEKALAEVQVRPGDLIAPELRLAAAMLLTPILPCNASAWAEQGLEAAFVAKPGLTIDQVHMNESLVERVIRVRALLYDFLKANEPG